MKTPIMEKNHNSDWRERLTLASVRNESGAALIVAMLLLMVLAILAPTAMDKLSQDYKRTSSYTDSRDLFYLAEAGMEHGKAMLKEVRLNAILAGPDDNPATLADNGLSFVITEPTPGTLLNTLVGSSYEWPVSSGTFWNHVPFSGGDYYFRIYDNDDDADQTTDIDNLAYIESVGIDASGTQIKTLRALVYKYSFPPTTFPAAVTMTGPDADLSGGGSMDISGGTGFGATAGNGWNFDDTADTSCVGKEALAFEEAGTLIQYTGGGNQCGADVTGLACMQLTNSNAYDNFTGLGSWPATPDNIPSHAVNATSFTEADALEMYNRFINPPGGGGTTADYTIVVDTNTSADMGSLDDPVVMHYTADLRIAGNMNGYGVLIVDGDLDIAGTVNWKGIIMVSACSGCTGELGGNGSLNLYGAVVSSGGVTAFSGSSDVKYSCKGIEVANSANGGSFNVASWTEVD